MSRNVLSLIICAALTLASCNSAEQPEPNRVVGVGSSVVLTQWLSPLNAIVGADAGNGDTTVVFDTTVTVNHPDRIVVSGFFSQAVTVLYRVKHNGSSTWRTVNGSGDAISANAQTALEYVVQGQNSQVEIVAGSPAPSTAELDIGLVYERAKPN